MDLRHCERGRDEVCGGRVCRVGAGTGAQGCEGRMNMEREGTAGFLGGEGQGHFILCPF